MIVFTGRKVCQKDLTEGSISTKASKGRIRQYCFYTIKLFILGETGQDKVRNLRNKEIKAHRNKMVEGRWVRRQLKGDEMTNRSKPWNRTDGVRNMM